MPRGSKMSPMKKFMEARMGKFYSDVSLKQFLLNDKKVLRFFAVWDDRKSLGGEVHMYTINMYLADCTCEVLERFEKNSGSVPFRGFRGLICFTFISALSPLLFSNASFFATNNTTARMLNRARLPKDFDKVPKTGINEVNHLNQQGWSDAIFSFLFSSLLVLILTVLLPLP